MITVYLRYVIDSYEIADFEEYGRRWMALVDELGTLAAYETYRSAAATDERCQAVMDLAETSRCILSYERTFLRPLAHPAEQG